jgi:hypothetical protein
MAKMLRPYRKQPPRELHGGNQPYTNCKRAPKLNTENYCGNYTQKSIRVSTAVTHKWGSKFLLFPNNIVVICMIVISQLVFMWW